MQGELAQALRAVRSAFLGAGAFSCAVNVLLLAPALYMLQVYDRVLASRSEDTLYLLTLILLGLLVLEAMLELVRSRVLVRAAAALDVGLGPRVFDASFERYLRLRTGNPSAAIADLAQLRQFLTGRGLAALLDAPWTPVYLAVVFILSPALGYFALGCALALLGLAYANERATAPALAEAASTAQAAGHFALASLRNAEAIAAHGMLGRLRARWFARHGHSLRLQALAADRAASVGAATRFLRTAVQSLILGAGALLVLENQLTAGGMIAASILLARALAPVDQAIGNWRSVVQARQSYARLNALLSAYPAAPDRTELPRPAGEVALEQLVVAPPAGSSPVLKGVQLRVAAGMLVAIAGPSAAGKSTLARALVGVWPPASGFVRLDGVDVSRWSREELGPWLGYLPQDVELFEGTVAENIARFGEPDDAQVVAAARKAGVHDMVLRLPEGYDTQIGERGMTLSGGQRQRIALARALYGEPALVVLDEPDASLDEAGEQALLAALAALRAEKCTVFVITHRPAILAAADVVGVLANGLLRAHAPAASTSLPRLREGRAG